MHISMFSQRMCMDMDFSKQAIKIVRFKTGSQTKIQVVALNKTGNHCIYQCFLQECVWIWILANKVSKS